MMETSQELQWNPHAALESPFPNAEIGEAEEESIASGNGAMAFAPWSESFTPFAEEPSGAAGESDAQRLLAEAFAELRDETFDEALAFLAEETEQAVEERFAGETALSHAERERFADAHLSPVRFEAEQYLANLEANLAGMDVGSLSAEQLEETLDRFDPQPGELTPAGEEFIGKLVRKAKGVVKVVARAAKGVVKTVGKVAGAVIGPVLRRLRGLINPLLRRVLSFAIGRLPAPLQPAARKLAGRIKLEAEAEEALDEEPASPANLTNVEMLAESFDAALAEAIVTGASETEEERESFAAEDEADVESRELERLAEARGVLIDELRDAYEGQDLAPAIEQFVPALLGALRLGINLIGRPKVVSFLAKYLGQLIGKWVGPQLSKPLSSAIVDTGLRLIALEAEAEAAVELTESEAAPVALASVIEDTVRRLAENEDYVFENDELTQLATAEALSAAVATHFPPRFVRKGLQQAPSLGGTFVARKPRKVRTYRKYSRVPEVEVTSQIADALPTFGGTTVGAVLRASGAKFPIKSRVHIYQATIGTTLPQMMRIDRQGAGAGRSHVSSANVHPLTTAAAGLLLREPKLGADVPSDYLRSRQKIAVGQRFYLLEPIGSASTLNLPAAPAARAAAARLAPSRAWTVVNLRQARVTGGMYLAEEETQRIVASIRQGQGAMTLLKALKDAYQRMDRFAASANGHVRIVREDTEALAEFEELSARGGLPVPPALIASLRKRLRSWVLPALASWAKANAEGFARAAAHPDAGVTIRVRLTSVPGLGLAGARGGGGGTPAISISIAPGRGRK